MITLIVVCVILSGLQVAAALPWMMGLDIVRGAILRQMQVVLEAARRQAGTAASPMAPTPPMTWLLSRPLFHVGWIGVGVAAGVFLSFNNDPSNLARLGRVYGSLLHFQLAADFFVGAFWLMLTLWPKGGAVALAAFREGLRQPMYWLLFIAALALIAVSPFVPYFTFGEDLKMVKELGYAFTMLFAGVFAVLAASMSISEEIEGRTAVTLMSKPVSRRQFLLGKFAGILLAALFMTVVLGWVLVWIIIFKQWYDPNLTGEVPPDPAWLVGMSRDLLGAE